MPRKNKVDASSKKQSSKDTNDDANAEISKQASVPTYNVDEEDLTDTSSLSKAGKRPVHVHVTVRQGESVEQMLRRFNFAVTRSNVIEMLRDNQYYEKPSKRRQREEKMRLTQRRNDD